MAFKAKVTLAGGRVVWVEYDFELDAAQAICWDCKEHEYTRDVTIIEITEEDEYTEVPMNAPENQELVADIGDMLGHGLPQCKCWDKEPDTFPRQVPKPGHPACAED